MVENFQALRQLSKRLVATEFQPAWLFRIEIEGAPEDFDLYVKEISYPIFETNTEEENVGSGIITFPAGRQAQQMSVTVRDNMDMRVSKFLKKWANKVIHTDGTVGLPYGENGYVRKVKRYLQKIDGTETLVDTFEMYPITCGECTQSRDTDSGFLEFPAVFVRFSNLEFIVPEQEEKTDEEKKKDKPKVDNQQAVRDDVVQA